MKRTIFALGLSLTALAPAFAHAQERRQASLQNVDAETRSAHAQMMLMEQRHLQRQAKKPGANLLTNLIPIAAIVSIFYLLLVRPNQKKQWLGKTRATNPGAEGGNFCHTCGVKFEGGEKFCGQCGAERVSGGANMLTHSWGRLAAGSVSIISSFGLFVLMAWGTGGQTSGQASDVIFALVPMLVGGALAEWLAVDRIRTSLSVGFISGSVAGALANSLYLRQGIYSADMANIMLIVMIICFGLAGAAITATGGGAVWLSRRAISNKPKGA